MPLKKMDKISDFSASKKESKFNKINKKIKIF